MRRCFKHRVTPASLKHAYLDQSISMNLKRRKKKRKKRRNCAVWCALPAKIRVRDREGELDSINRIPLLNALPVRGPGARAGHIRRCRGRRRQVAVIVLVEAADGVATISPAGAVGPVFGNVHGQAGVWFNDAVCDCVSCCC